MPDVLPARVLNLLAGDDVKAISSVSLLEAAILHRLGRFAFSGAIEDFFAVALSRDLRPLDVTPAVAAGTNRLPGNFQGDPFDRTIAATAAIHNLTLITCGERIRDSRVCATEFYPFKPGQYRRSD